MASPALPRPDVLIAGAGIIGLSLALEMHTRGAQVLVLEKDKALGQASTAAAGMLAVQDPSTPPQLCSLARYSLALYPCFLQRIEQLSGLAVPFQTGTTIQYRVDGSRTTISEHSLDPRQLGSALLAAVRATSIELREDAPFNGERFPTKHFIDATGAWAGAHSAYPVIPRKGQMLRVQLPPSLPLREVHRSEQVYIVPRTSGPQAGTALIGATVEDAGFDTSLHPADLEALRVQAAGLLPALASVTDAPMVEAWAGLRPSTPDELPLLGFDPRTNTFLATGHYRNGILLAPATAAVVADLLEGREPAVDLRPFDPQRFSCLQNTASIAASTTQ